MDLRVVKTKKSIEDAFLQLRSSQPLEKIKVTELCEIALINKTTFYTHFQDIYDLSDQIEDETISSILSQFTRLDSLFTDPTTFIKGLYFLFKSNEELVKTLFSGRMDLLVDKIEKQLNFEYPQFSEQPEKEIALSFIIHGATHVLNEPKFSEEILLNTLSKIVTQIISI